MTSPKKMPGRPRAHVVGDTALRVFEVRCKRKWAINRSQTDYGWDAIVTIAKRDEVHHDFYAQVKGSDSPDYTNSGKQVSHPLRVSTVRWLLDKTTPSMLCVCDTGKKLGQEPIYWIWLQEAIKEISTKNPSWDTQEEVTFHVPCCQTLSPGSHEAIEEYVHNYYTESKIEKAIGETLGMGFGTSCPTTLAEYRDKTDIFMQDKVLRHLKDAGLVDVVEEKEGEKVQSFCPEDQKRYREVAEVSTYLKAFRDTDAERILNHLQEGIDEAADGIKARYFNNRGVLALHLAQDEEALSWFDKAYGLRPQEKKYSTNLLFLQHHLHKTQEVPLPKDWQQRLDDVLAKSSEYAPAVRLKAYWIGETKGPLEASRYIQSSPVWEKEPLECIGSLAEIYKESGDYERALGTLEDAEKLNLQGDALFHSLQGLVYLLKAIGVEGRSPEFSIYGPGSHEMDVYALRKSLESYDKAFKGFEEKGMPRIAEPTTLNYSTVLTLLGQHPQCEHACREYLNHHSESAPILNALALSLVHQNRPHHGIKYAEKAFELNPSSMIYRNLLLCCFMSEAHERVIALVSERERRGFADQREEGMSRVLVAAAYHELGEPAEADKQIRFMRENKSLQADAVIAEAERARRNRVPREEIIDIYKKALRENPDDTHLLTNLVLYMGPPNKDNAAELIQYMTTLSRKRQLMPEEFLGLGNAHIVLREPLLAEQTFDRAIHRYPYDLRFIYKKAEALMEQGHEQPAFQILEQYLEKVEKDYSSLRNTAFLAFDIGRLDEAIKLFQLALHKATSEKQRGEIHLLLYELKTRRKDPPKEVFSHAVGFGKTVGNDVAQEARYLIMGLLSPHFSEKDMDSEFRGWVKELQARLEKFSKEHPKYEGLMSFTIPDGIPEEEKGLYLRAQIASIMLPHQLATEPIKIKARSEPLPLSFRADFFLEANSVFDFWTICSKSRDFAHAIHISSNINALVVENKNASEAEIVCVDLTALMTLAELDLLDLLSDSFEQIIVARGTKVTLDWAHLRFQAVHPLCSKIEKWRLANLRKTRVRYAAETRDETKNEGYERSTGGIWLLKERRLDQMVGDGVGETLLLARELKVPLYSDESLMRYWGAKDYGLMTFSTLSLVRRLRQAGSISITTETRLLAGMLEKNFRIVPFEPIHLNCRLKELISAHQQKTGTLPKSDDFQSDKILGVLLRQFADSLLNPKLFYRMAVDWWLSALSDKEIPDEILAECMYSPSFSLSLKSDGGVLTGIVINERNERLAVLWASFLWRACREDKQWTRISWSAIDSCCKLLYPRDEAKYKAVLHSCVPKWLAKIAEAEKDIKDSRKVSILISLTQRLPQVEREIFETYFVKHRPDFII